MSKTYILKRPSAALVTMEFDTFTQAREFEQSSAILQPSKPYKRIVDKAGNLVPIWCVSIPARQSDSAIYELAA